MRLQALAKEVGITTAKAERFIVELANLQPSKDADNRILKRFPEFFPEFLHDPKMADRLREWLLDIYPHGAAGFVLRAKKIYGWESEDIPKTEFLLYLSKLFLPGIWASTDLRAVQWKIFGTRLFFGGPTESRTLLQSLVDPPSASPFDVAMLYLWENFDRTRRCPNSDCPAPYFFAKKKGRVYCSDACAAEAQREYKRKWWAEHGKQWRKEQRKK